MAIVVRGYGCGPRHAGVGVEGAIRCLETNRTQVYKSERCPAEDLPASEH
jgi:hypothetical protein